MKRTLLFALLLIFAIGMFSNVYAQINVTIGNGTTTNTTTGGPAPYGTWYKKFREQYLVLASEIEDQGGGPGNINSVAFNVAALNTCSPMPNYTIRLKHTTQTALTTTFEDGTYQTVFVQNDFLPVVGWNTHTFSAPFVWDGTSNILVDVYTSLIPGGFTQNASTYYSTTTFNSSLRFQNDTAEASTATTGTTSLNRSNIRFNMEALVVDDPPNPAQIVSPADGAVNVMTSATLNWASGGGAPTGYKVHFGTTNPPPFIQNTTETTYAPTLAINTTYYWKIIPFNAEGDAVNCPVWSFTTGGPVVTMTNGTQSVTDGMTYAFYDSGGPDGQYQNSENYTFTFSAANPTSIIHVTFTYFDLESGWDYLKIYNGPDTSAPQVGPAAGYSGTALPDELIGSNAVTFVFTSDGSFQRNGWAAAVSAVNLEHDLGAQSIAGNTTPSVGDPTTYTVAVKNNGANTENTYTVKLMGTGNVELASIPGTSIAPQQTIDFAITWTPSATGAMEIWGEVVLANDGIASNNQTPHMNISVQAAGVVAVTIGDGSQTGLLPLNFFYNNSLSETVYPANEMNIGGLITGIQYYNDFTLAGGLTDKPTKIWMGEIADADLTAGWVPSTSLTSVFDGLVDYPTGQNDINITLQTPYVYGGGNLVVMAQRPMDTGWFSGVNFRTQTIGTSRTLAVYSDGTAFDPAAPPAGTAPTGMFPKTTFFLIVDDMGALTGTVFDGATPLPGATVSITGTPLTTTTDANGVYNFPYVMMGAQTVVATKHGYNEVTHAVTIIEDQTVTQDFVLTQLPQVTVTGRIVGSDNPTVGIAGATISLSGYEPYSATTNATGYFTINNVFASQTYNYVASATGYQNATGTAVVGTTNLNMGTITVNELAFPPYQVVATEATDYSNVALTWMAPDPNAVGEWIYYDTGLNEDSIGLTAGGEFSAAIRFPASALTDYAGMSLYAISLWPGDPATYSLRVWTGGTPTSPGTQVVDQPFTVPTADVFQTVLLDNPVVVSGTEELWFGYNVTHTGGMYPAGCDGGPALNGFGNMIYNAGAWSTLYDLAPTLNYNWNIRGYVGFSAPTRAPEVTPLAMKTGAFGEANGNDRVLGGYKVWRLLAANQDNESLWTPLTPTNITPTNYTDNAWAPLPSGVYKYAVKAVYTNDVMSPAAFSNEIHKGMMGVLSGTVTEFGTNVPIAGATITAGDYSGTSDATGNYSFGVYQGTYTVTCVKTGYQAGSQAGVSITGLQTTNLNFVLTEITLPPGAVQAVEASPSLVNVTWMEPGSGTDISEGFEGTAFPPTDWTQIINNTGAAGTTGVYPTWCQVGEVALTPAVPPHTGAYQAALWWDYAHQDEWLITPEFICPPAADLNFWTYVYLGSTNLDHYNVKVSTDGTTWTTLWDATALTGGWNYYDTPIAVDLDSYAGQEIKLAWQAVDGDGQGLWYVWFLDDIVVGNPTTTLRFPASSLTRVSAAGNDHRAPETVMPKRPISREMMHSSGLTSANKVANETVVRDDRVLNGYKVWRLLQGQENNESAWVQLTPDVITATAWQDGGWGSVPDGNYKWAVKAIYTAGATSTPSFSIVVPKQTQIGTIAGIVRNQQNAPIMGATVSCGDVTATTNASGAYSMQVVAGTHSVTATAAGYAPGTQTGVIVVTGQTTTVNFQLPASSNLLNDGFETYADFATTFAPWTNIDVDQSTTYTMQNVTWPGSGAAMAFMVFNPTTTTPPITTFTAHGGTKMAVAIASQTPPNNDWLITPQLNGASQIKFWARSLTAEYGLERFKVGVSTTGTNPNNFTIISGTNYIQAPVDWTEYIYNIPASRVPVYIGIQCVSNDAWFFMVDDVRVNGSDGDDPVVPVVATELKNNFPNPFNPETTIAYSVKEASPVSIEIYNVKGQLVKTLVNEVQEAGNHSIVWKGTDNNGRSVSSGIYYYKMIAGQYSSTKKMIMMK